MNVLVYGDKVRELRLNKLMEREELEELSGVSRSTVTRIELGKSTARLATVKKLAVVLGVDPSDLFEEEVVPPRKKVAS